MRQNLSILKKSKLFCGLNDEEILSILSCLNAKQMSFSKDAAIFLEGDEASFMGVILDGEVVTQKIDYSGNINIISKLYPSDLIAASSCFSTSCRLPFDVVCASPCTVLCLDLRRIIQPCCNLCTFHTGLIRNMLSILADRNILFAGKIDILTRRSIRDKALAYLHSQSKRAHSQSFSIPLSRRQMADFLSTNRSALSRELLKLQEEGLIEFSGNSFVLKTP